MRKTLHLCVTIFLTKLKVNKHFVYLTFTPQTLYISKTFKTNKFQVSMKFNTTSYNHNILDAEELLKDMEIFLY